MAFVGATGIGDTVFLWWFGWSITTIVYYFLILRGCSFLEVLARGRKVFLPCVCVCMCISTPLDISNLPASSEANPGYIKQNRNSPLSFLLGLEVSSCPSFFYPQLKSSYAHFVYIISRKFNCTYGCNREKCISSTFLEVKAICF